MVRYHAYFRRYNGIPLGLRIRTMAGESGSLPSSLENSVTSNTREEESDIEKVIEGLREMRYDSKLTQEHTDLLAEYIEILSRHSCAVQPQVEDDTPEWDSNTGKLPQATSTPQRTGTSDSGYLSAQDSELLDAVAQPLERIKEELQQWPPPSKGDDSASDVEFEGAENEEEAEVPEPRQSHEETPKGTEGQKVEMVTGSRTRDKIRQEITVHQSTQPSSESVQPVQVEGMLEGTMMVQGLEARSSTRHLNIPHETRLDLVKIIREEEVREIEEGSLQTTVNVIYKHHCYKRQKHVELRNTPSDDSSEYILIVDGFISFVLVTEAAAKVRSMDDPASVEDEALEHCEWYLEQLEPGEAIAAESRKKLATTIVGAPMFILYKRQQKAKKYERVHGYTAEQFTEMCDTMRKAFLSWKQISKHVPADHESEQQVPKIGARELQSAVMRSGKGAVPEAEGEDGTEAVEEAED